MYTLKDLLDELDNEFIKPLDNHYVVNAHLLEVKAFLTSRIEKLVIQLKQKKVHWPKKFQRARDFKKCVCVYHKNGTRCGVCFACVKEETHSEYRGENRRSDRVNEKIEEILSNAGIDPIDR